MWINEISYLPDLEQENPNQGGESDLSPENQPRNSNHHVFSFLPVGGYAVGSAVRGGGGDEALQNEILTEKSRLSHHCGVKSEEDHAEMDDDHPQPDPHLPFNK